MKRFLIIKNDARQARIEKVDDAWLCGGSREGGLSYDDIAGPFGLVIADCSSKEEAVGYVESSDLELVAKF